MENGFDLLMKAFGVFLFCLAISLTVELFRNLEQMEGRVVDNLYDSHVFYSVLLE